MSYESWPCACGHTVGHHFPPARIQQPWGMCKSPGCPCREAWPVEADPAPSDAAAELMTPATSVDSGHPTEDDDEPPVLHPALEDDEPWGGGFAPNH